MCGGLGGWEEEGGERQNRESEEAKQGKGDRRKVGEGNGEEPRDSPGLFTSFQMPRPELRSLLEGRKDGKGGRKDIRRNAGSSTILGHQGKVREATQAAAQGKETELASSSSARSSSTSVR